MYTYELIIITFIAFGSVYSIEKQTFKPVQQITVIDCFDKHLSKLSPIIKEYGLDPIKFPDVSKKISGVTLNLTNGMISGASNLLAKDDCVITFYPNHWRFKVKIHPGKMEFRSNYSASKYILGFNPELEGRLVASIENVTVSISVDLEVFRFTLTNPQVHIDDLGIISLDMGGGTIASEFQKLLVSYLQKKLKSFAQSTASDVTNEAFSIHNENVDGSIISIFEHVVPILAKQYLPGIRHQSDVQCLLERYTNKKSSDFLIPHYTKLARKLLTKSFWEQVKSDVQEEGGACVQYTS